MRGDALREQSHLAFGKRHLLDVNCRPDVVDVLGAGLLGFLVFLVKAPMTLVLGQRLVGQAEQVGIAQNERHHQSGNTTASIGQNGQLAGMLLVCTPGSSNSTLDLVFTKSKLLVVQWRRCWRDVRSATI